MAIEVMRELHRITEYRNNSIYKTELIWVGWFHESEVPKLGQKEGYLYVTMSTDYSSRFPTVRRAR